MSTSQKPGGANKEDLMVKHVIKHPHARRKLFGVEEMHKLFGYRTDGRPGSVSIGTVRSQMKNCSGKGAVLYINECIDGSKRKGFLVANVHSEFSNLEAQTKSAKRAVHKAVQAEKNYNKNKEDGQ